MTTFTDEEIASRLDLDHIREAAAFAATQIQGQHAAAVSVTLTPGDMTAYQIIVVSPDVPTWRQPLTAGPLGGGSSPYMVALYRKIGSASYPWHGHAVNPSYAAAKWTRGRSRSDLWTGAVVATFLNLLAEALA